MMFLQAQAWKIATALAAMLAVTLGISLGDANFRLHEMTRARDKALAGITDLGTGWASRLATCQANLAVSQGAIASQNAAIAVAAAKAGQQAERANAALTAANKTADARQARIDELMKPLTEGDECKQIKEIDDRLIRNLQ